MPITTIDIMMDDGSPILRKSERGITLSLSPYLTLHFYDRTQLIAFTDSICEQLEETYRKEGAA